MSEHPISFNIIIGHAHPKAILKAAIASGRVAHAYLFHGEPHIGKFTSALAFAKTALCTMPGSNRAAVSGSDAAAVSCNRCSSCHAVDTASHPDVQIVRPDGAQIKIEQIRELQNAIAYKPLVGSRKWFIIDEADALTLQAANCILKTLEEPPEYSTLILITARPQALLPTIVSRCQGVRFNPPPQSEIQNWLVNRRGMDPEAAKLLTALTLGKVGIAAGADPTALKNERDRIIKALTKEHLEDLSDLFNAPEELASTQEQLSDTLDAIEIWLRDILVSQHSLESSLLVHQDIEDRTRERGREISTEQILETLALIHALKRAAPRNLNHALVLETVLLKLRDATGSLTASGGRSGRERHRERP